MTMADRNLTRPDELSPGLSFYRSPEGELFCEDIPLRDLARRSARRSTSTRAPESWSGLKHMKRLSGKSPTRSAMP